MLIRVPQPLYILQEVKSSKWDILKETAAKSKLILHDKPIYPNTSCWGKEYDFILKAGRLKRWQTNVSE